MRHEPDLPQTATDPILPLSRRRKAAIIVQLLISDGSKLSLADLPDRLQEDLTAELASIRLVDRDTVNAVAAEFADLLDAIGLSAPGGVAAALDALSDHLSPDIATRLRGRVTGSANADPWDRLINLDNETIQRILTAENTHIGAILMSKLPVPRAAELLGKLPGDLARRLAVGIKQTETIAPQSVARIGAALIANYSTTPDTAFTAPPGKRVGAILNAAKPSMRDTLLTGLDADDQGFAADVRKSIFTFEDIPARVRPVDLPMCLRDIAPDDLATAMAYATATGNDAAKTATFILDSLSQRMASQIRDTIEDLGEVSAQAGESAMSILSASVRAQADSGRISLIQTEAP
ncbi:flagellar motor switch protein FliG [Loktanella sp. DSM 29012]|uniref:FliG C-terminal domain-containing protein n=1 Tax=Loktanella sp. DSM 29012 TaxID=1881056 RepID=UPI0008C7D25D|nr:FliG C-terminal domain-containing protein [Loktanella sp. DSM 29012]SEQ19428.1 flagellar motor switch protein FliG [Loktanella sp. DSM 29012]